MDVRHSQARSDKTFRHNTYIEKRGGVRKKEIEIF